MSYLRLQVKHLDEHPKVEAPDGLLILGYWKAIIILNLAYKNYEKFIKDFER
jgi:hypothetical protein